jgi:hypothetical protein
VSTVVSFRPTTDPSCRALQAGFERNARPATHLEHVVAWRKREQVNRPPAALNVRGAIGKDNAYEPPENSVRLGELTDDCGFDRHAPLKGARD